jgi:hypothetical protein
MGIKKSKDQEPGRGQLSELDLVYNPSLGAYLLWCADRGYFSEVSEGMPIPLAYLVLPLALHWQSRKIGISTNKPSGLTMFAAKLGEHQEDLLAVHQRALALRELSLASISLACATRLMAIDPGAAKVLPLEANKLPKPSESIQKLGALCEKFGTWFARLPPEQVGSVLRIEF